MSFCDQQLRRRLWLARPDGKYITMWQFRVRTSSQTGRAPSFFSSCDKYLETLTMSRHQISLVDSRARRAMLKGEIQKALRTKIRACARRQEYFMLLYSLPKDFKDKINFKVGNSRA